MNYESKAGQLISTVHPELNWSTEQDTRLVPILPLVNDLYDTLSKGDSDSVAGNKLQRIGDLLIPHANSLEPTLSIADFIQIGTTAEIYKGQYWSYRIKVPGIDSKPTEFRIDRTDVYNGGGVSLNIGMYKEDQFSLGLVLQRDFGQAWIGAGRNKSARHELAFQKSVWRNNNWKAVEPK